MANKYPAQFAERRRDITLIHVAKQKLGMDDETYRAMLWTVARVKSSAELDFAGRRKVLDHLKGCGFKVQAARPAPAKDKAALVAKIRALLIALDHKPDSYADGMARNMFKVDRFEWCTPEQLGKIVAALNYSVKRAQVK
jgi:phage gp16-like protein